MEGTYTLTDLSLFEAGAAAAKTGGDNREVLHCVRAREGAIDDLPNLPISSRLIRDAHRVLLTSTGFAGAAGSIRRSSFPRRLPRYRARWIR